MTSSGTISVRVKRSRAFGLLGCVLLAGTPAFAGPATQPTTAPSWIEPAKDETPVQAIARGGKVYDQLDVSQIEKLLVVTPRTREYVHSFAVFGRAMSLIEKASRSKFGDASTVELMHASGSCAESDLPGMRATVDGDHAKVIPWEGAEPFEMVRENGVWLLDVDSTIRLMNVDELKEAAAQGLADAATLEKVASDVDDGRIKSSAELLQKVKAIINSPATK